jgi:hypothetical protein
VWFISAGKLTKLHSESLALPSAKVNQMVAGAKPMLATNTGLYLLAQRKFALDASLARLLGSKTAVRQVAVAADGRIAVAAQAVLFLKPANVLLTRPPTIRWPSGAPGRRLRPCAFFAW